MKFYVTLLCSILCGVILGTAASAVSDPISPLERLTKGVRRVELSNGLRVLIYRREQVPIFSAQLWVKVGGVDELPGKTGIAHLLEHMAFKGTTSIGTKDAERERALLEELERFVAKLPPDQNLLEQAEYKRLQAELEQLTNDNEFSRRYQRLGAVGLNAATSKDYTMYEVSLPADAFSIWCEMEGDRLKNPVFRQFYKEREVVQEERRSRTDDNPGGQLYEALLSTAYWAHPNRLPVIGWPSDLKRLTATDIKHLHQTYYRPDNLVISLVGDLDPDAIAPQLEKCFGSLPRVTTPLPKVNAIEPPQNGERTSIVDFDAEPAFMMAYHKPVFPNPDDIHFSVLHEVLSGGRSSMFNRQLIEGRQIALSVSTTEAPGERFPSLFIVEGSPRSGVTSEQLRDEVQKLLDGLKSERLTEEQIKAAKRRVQVSLISALDDNDGLASMLGRYELLHGDWQVFVKMYDILRSTTADDVKRLVETYLTPANRTFVQLVRPRSAK